MLEVDPNLGLLPRRAGAIWSAPLKKQWLTSWQTMAHNMMGQLSLIDRFRTMSMEIVDQSVLPTYEYHKSLIAILDVQVHVLADYQKVGVHLEAYLDLTVREAELNIGKPDDYDLRARPLFNGLTPTEVQAISQKHRDDALISSATKSAMKSRSS